MDGVPAPAMTRAGRRQMLTAALSLPLALPAIRRVRAAPAKTVRIGYQKVDGFVRRPVCERKTTR